MIYIHVGITNRTDYAHGGPAFHTWHRYFNLWLEWEMQYKLKSMRDPNYHSFRLPYWDWRAEIQKSTGIPAEKLFTRRKLGATIYNAGFPRVVGNIVAPTGWSTLCVGAHTKTCNPKKKTGALKRCPFTRKRPCNSNNPDWDTIKQINDLLAINIYDSPPYNLYSRKGFRAFVDFYIHDDFEECRKDRMCMCLPFGGVNCNLTNVPPNARVAAYSSGMHYDVS